MVLSEKTFGSKLVMFHIIDSLELISTTTSYQWWFDSNLSFDRFTFKLRPVTARCGNFRAPNPWRPRLSSIHCDWTDKAIKLKVSLKSTIHFIIFAVSLCAEQFTISLFLPSNRMWNSANARTRVGKSWWNYFYEFWSCIPTLNILINEHGKLYWLQEKVSTDLRKICFGTGCCRSSISLITSALWNILARRSAAVKTRHEMSDNSHAVSATLCKFVVVRWWNNNPSPNSLQSHQLACLWKRKQ